MVKTKVFAAYLPQYHEIEENNIFWGKGYTDWVGVKKAEPQFDGHIQPNIPLHDNYYDLSNVDTIRWQAKLAKEYKIDGFEIYHYWFKDSHKVLEKPAELLLDNQDIDIEFFFNWDNTSWVRSWSNISGNDWSPLFDNEGANENGKDVLLEHNYGNEDDWKKHFDYLLQFFKDKRYYKISGRPVFLFMSVANAPLLKRMIQCWDEWSREEGFAGICAITCKSAFINKNVTEKTFIYQPLGIEAKNKIIKNTINSILKKQIFKKKLSVKKYEYQWIKILIQSYLAINKDVYVSGVVKLDDTPRRGNMACIWKNPSPKSFEIFFDYLYKLCCKKNKEFMLLTAWNEWGEGAYLEPDTITQYGYLEKVRDVISKNNM